MRQNTVNKPKQKSEKRQRNLRRTFRMNEKEQAAFLANCEAANLSAGDLFRSKCCDQKPLRKKRTHHVDEQLLAQLLGQMGRYGNNLNQIAHALNVAGKNSDFKSVIGIASQNEQRIKEIQEHVIEIRDLLRQALLKHDLAG